MITPLLANKLSKPGGTLFLNEIGNLSLTTQAKLSRALQEKKNRKSDAILAQDLPLEIQKISDPSRLIISSSRLSLKERVGELEKELITGALERLDGSRLKRLNF